MEFSLYNEFHGSISAGEHVAHAEFYKVLTLLDIQQRIWMNGKFVTCFATDFIKKKIEN